MFKINIADKSGKTFKLELETEEFMGKSLHDKIQGKDLLPDLSDYEFEISGTSDKAGFTSMKGVPGIGLKKVLLTYEKGMKKHPRKEGKRKRSNPTPKGLRLRKTVRGEVISPEITQINLKIVKEGAKKLAEVFPDQNRARESKENRASKRKGAQKEAEKAPEPKPEAQKEEPKKEEAPKPVQEEKPAETPKEEPKPEEKAE